MIGFVKAFTFCVCLGWLATSSLTVASGAEPAIASPPAASPPAVKALQLALLRTAVVEADKISDDLARQQAQWNLVRPLVLLGLRDEAFQQAMKLRTSNPQMCIYSLTTIALDALRRGKNGDVQKAWDEARRANADAGRKHDHYVIEFGFKIDRPLSELTDIAVKAAPEDRQRAFRDIRNELARRGKVDEAYAITAAHLSAHPTATSKEFHDREIAYYCSAANQFNDPVTHDHLGQAVAIVERMAKGEHRDAAIIHLIDGLLYISSEQKVSQDRLAQAETWVGHIDDRNAQAAARAKILSSRLAAKNPAMGVDELEKQFAAAPSREEKLIWLRSLFDRHLDENRFEAADAILARQVEVIRSQPRPEMKSKFGNVDDEEAIRIAAWLHHRAIVKALNKAGQKDQARERLDALKELPDSPPIFMIGNLADIRLSLAMELEDFEAVEKLVEATSDPSQRAAATVAMAAWMMRKGQFERGWKHVEPLIEQPPESLAPADRGGLYLWAQPFESLARELLQAGRPDEATAFLGKIPESRETAAAFESFGEWLVESGRLFEAESWVAKLPHETARAHARFGALRASLAAFPSL